MQPRAGRNFMRRKILFVRPVASVVGAARAGLAAAAPPAAIAGQVGSADEARMEGVLVSAKRDGATTTVTVVSDAQGRYSFPAAKLDAGRYTLTIRAVGYELDGAKTTVTVVSDAQ